MGNPWYSAISSSRKKEPVENTCPLIDTIIGIIEDCYLEFPREPFLKKQFDMSKPILEEIRTANSSLREWGGKNAEEADEFEEKFDDAEKKIDTLERRIAELEQTILEHEQIISERDERIEELETENESLDEIVRNHPG